MTVTATTPAPSKRRTSKPAPAPANPVVTPEQAEEMRITARLAELKTAYTTARTGEAGTHKALKAAKEQWENSRVVTSRILYAAAMLKPLEDGSPNRTFAAREMHMTETQLALTGQALKDATKSAKASIKNYVSAGIALQDAGLNPLGEGDKGNTSEPTAEERKVVAEAFRAGNKRPAGDPASTKDTGNGGGEGEGDGEGVGPSTPPAGDNLSAVDLMGHIGRMQATLKLIVAGSVPVSEDEAANISAMLEDFQSELAAYVAG